MTPGNGSDTARPRLSSIVSRRSIGLLVAALLAVALVLADARLKDSPNAGFQLESAVWRLESADLPAVWEGWAELEASAAMREASPAFHNDLPLAIRRMTGIRPTPARLRLWLGSHMMAAGGGEGWCLSLRPGLAMRLASWFRGPLAPGNDDAIWKNFAHAWREEFLLIASSRAYLDRVLDEGNAVRRGDVPRDTIQLHWKGALPGSLSLRAKPDLPVRFTFAAAAPEDAALHYAGGWPETILLANMRRDSPLHAAAGSGARWLESQIDPEIAALLRELAAAWWTANSPVPLSTGSEGEWAAGLFDADFDSEVPAVEWVWACRGAGPLLDGWRPEIRWEHRWNEIAGWLIPVPGASHSWAAAEYAGSTYLTSHEQRMPVVLASSPREPEPGVAALAWQWKPLTEILRTALSRGARDGLLPGRTEYDIEADWLPYVEALAGLGTLQLQARGAGDHIAGDGWLARGAGDGK